MVRLLSINFCQKCSIIIFHILDKRKSRFLKKIVPNIMLCKGIISRSNFENPFISSRDNNENPLFCVIAYVPDQTGSGISEPKFIRSNCCFQWAYVIRILKIFPFVSKFFRKTRFSGVISHCPELTGRKKIRKKIS